MPNLGFSVLDYSSKRKLGNEENLTVFAPRRPATMPPLVELPHSSIQLRDSRLYFKSAANESGDIVISDVPAGVYRVIFHSPRYIPAAQLFVSPMTAPAVVELHRDINYPFSAEDTLFLGEVTNSSTGAPHTGFDVQLIDPDPNVPPHLVPLNEDGRFAIYAPEKTSAVGVEIRIFHSSGHTPVTLPSVVLHRTNVVPATSVP